MPVETIRRTVFRFFFIAWNDIVLFFTVETRFDDTLGELVFRQQLARASSVTRLLFTKAICNCELALTELTLVRYGIEAFPVTEMRTVLFVLLGRFELYVAFETNVGVDLHRRYLHQFEALYQSKSLR